MNKYRCTVCGYIYDESAGALEKGIAVGTKWENLPDNFVCPVCGAPESVFKPYEEASPAPASAPESGDAHIEAVRDLSAGEISAILSNLAKGCEKQRLIAEMDAFNKISAYFKAKTSLESGKTLTDAAELLSEDMANRFPAANAAAAAEADRGAQRSLVWSEKVSVMAQALLDRFAKEGDAMLEDTKIYVCDICGFIYLGDTPPEICPVCKVPSFKITMVERRKNHAGV